MRFTASRVDGRSQIQVVLDYLVDGAPGQVYTHADLATALGAETDQVFGRPAVRRIVASCYGRLLLEQQRAIHSVRGVGYRLALASDQQGLALARKRRSDVQLLGGLRTLQHVQWHELDVDARRVHEGTLLIIGALWANQRALERRQEAVELAVRSLGARVAVVESSAGPAARLDPSLGPHDET